MVRPVVAAVAFAADVLDEVDEVDEVLFTRVPAGATTLDVVWRITVLVPAPFAEVPLTGPFTVVVDAIERGSLASGRRVVAGSFDIESSAAVGDSRADAPGATPLLTAPIGTDACGSDSSGPPEGRVSSSRASAFGWPKSSTSAGGSTTSGSGKTGSLDVTAALGAVAIGAVAGTTATAWVVAFAAAATRSVCAIAPMSAKVAAVAVAPVMIRLA